MSIFLFFFSNFAHVLEVFYLVFWTRQRLMLNPYQAWMIHLVWKPFTKQSHNLAKACVWHLGLSILSPNPWIRNPLQNASMTSLIFFDFVTIYQLLSYAKKITNAKLNITVSPHYSKGFMFALIKDTIHYHHGIHTIYHLTYTLLSY